MMQLILVYRYWIIIPLSFIEGPIVAFVVGTLSFLGYFNPLLALIIFLVRDVLLDGIMYYLGAWGGKTKFALRMLKKIGVHEDHLEDVRRMWETHGFRTMFFSKLSYGVSAAFLIVAGMVEMPYMKFFRYAALVAIAQYGVLFVLGYFFGGAFGTVSRLLNNLQYVFAGVVLIATGYYVFTHFMRRRLLDEKKRPE